MKYSLSFQAVHLRLTTTTPPADGAQRLRRKVATGIDITVSADHRITVRTTLTVDDDVFQAAQALAESSGGKIGKVLSQLARRGLRIEASAAKEKRSARLSRFARCEADPVAESTRPPRERYEVKPALLDTNVLLALAWPNHQHHAAAHHWFRTRASRGWASCAVTQIAFVRLSSNPAYTQEAVLPREAAELLAALVQHKAHRFWPSPRADDSAVYTNALGHQQVNDAWLVAVARRQRGLLATFDTRLPVHAQGSDAVIVIPAGVAE